MILTAYSMRVVSTPVNIVSYAGTRYYMTLHTYMLIGVNCMYGQAAASGTDVVAISLISNQANITCSCVNVACPVDSVAIPHTSNPGNVVPI